MPIFADGWFGRCGFSRVFFLPLGRYLEFSILSQCEDFSGLTHSASCQVPVWRNIQLFGAVASGVASRLVSENKKARTR